MPERTAPRILEVDLAARRVEVTSRPDLIPALGGSGLAARLFGERFDRDPAAASHLFVLAGGPLAAAYPLATKVAAVFKSPLTGEYGESHAGGRLGLALRFTGYDAVVVHGRAEHPVYLTVACHDVAFGDAEAIWDLSCDESGRILRQLQGSPGTRSILRIGPAGTRGVAFACVNVDTWRHFGRLGLGAVFGAMNLKGIVVSGDADEPLPRRGEYLKLYREIYDTVVKTDALSKYHALGTAVNVRGLSGAGAFPTRNLRQASFEAADAISGEAFAERFLLRQIACSSCPVGCIHVALHRKAFDAKEHEYESKGVSYDYELISALGAMVGVGEPAGVIELIEAAESLGLDAISAGVLAAWTIEATERGLVTPADTGVEGLAFGAVDAIAALLSRIVRSDLPFHAAARRGLAHLAERYGGSDFAALTAGNEMAQYYTGYASLAGLAAGPRHSHLDNAGYSLDQKNPDLPPAEVARLLVEEAECREVLTALHVCLFARKVYTPELTRRALAAAGIDMTAEEIAAVGRRNLLYKHALRGRMGFRYDAVVFPKRFFETPALGRTLEPGRMRATLDAYAARVAELAEAASAQAGGGGA